VLGLNKPVDPAALVGGLSITIVPHSAGGKTSLRASAGLPVYVGAPMTPPEGDA
jgi:hypothetical protein